MIWKKSIENYIPSRLPSGNAEDGTTQSPAYKNNQIVRLLGRS